MLLPSPPVRFSTPERRQYSRRYLPESSSRRIFGAKQVFVQIHKRPPLGKAAFGRRISGMGLEGLGRVLILGAVVLLVVGVLFLLLGRLGLDRLPGDLVFRRGGLTVYFPLGLMILVSVVGTILLNLFFRR
jgi:hypothetical protein